MSGEVEASTGQSDFGRRFVDHAFRRPLWLVLPVLLFAAVGVLSARNITATYESSASLTASSNPLVDGQEIRGTEVDRFETAAAGTARLINEQVGTDTFVDRIAAGAGLAEAVSSGALDRSVIRRNVSAFARGQNLLSINAQWGDSFTAYRLVDATIDAYREMISEVLAVDTKDATSFWQERLTTAQERTDSAIAELEEFLASLPPLLIDEEYSVSDSLKIERLNAAASNSQDAVDRAEEGLNDALVNREKAQFDAFQVIRVIDPAVEEMESDPNTSRKVITVAMFTFIGLIVGLGALLLATFLDRSISSPRQLSELAGINVVAEVPHLSTRSFRRTPEAEASVIA